MGLIVLRRRHAYSSRVIAVKAAGTSLDSEIPSPFAIIGWKNAYDVYDRFITLS